MTSMTAFAAMMTDNDDDNDVDDVYKYGYSTRLFISYATLRARVLR